MDTQRLLIAAVIEDGDFTTVAEAQVKSDFFSDEPLREVFEWVTGYWKEYGETPTWKALRKEFPKQKWVKPEEPLKYYCDTLRRERRDYLTFSMLHDAVTHVDAERPDTDAALNRLSVGLTELMTEVTVLRDHDFVKTWEDRMAVYRAIKERGTSIRGIPTGFPTVDNAISGLQPEQLVTLIGEPKVGKSTLLLRSAIEAHKHGSTPLFIGFEMSNEEQGMRYDSMQSGVPFSHIYNGRLTGEEEGRLEQRLKSLSSMHPFIMSTDVTSTTTITGIRAKIEQYKPDVVFIDGVYMMDDENGEAKGSSQALTNITRGLKRLAQQTRLPIMVTTQVLTWKMSKKRGITADAIGYSSSFAQDSDVVFGVEHTDEEDIKKVKTVLSRNSRNVACLIQWDWDTGTFEEFAMEGEDDDDTTAY